MGLLQDDDTLSTAALREMVKLPIKLIGNMIILNILNILVFFWGDYFFF